MKKALSTILLSAILLTMMIGVPALADTAVAKQDGTENYLRITDDPCTNVEVLKIIPPKFQARFRASDLFYEGKHLESCWTLGSDGNVHAYDTDHDERSIPASDFTKDDAI